MTDFLESVIDLLKLTAGLFLVIFLVLVTFFAAVLMEAYTPTVGVSLLLSAVFYPVIGVTLYRVWRRQ